MTTRSSEFGAGIVVCLAKFSEHLHEHGPYGEAAIRRYAKCSDIDNLTPTSALWVIEHFRRAGGDSKEAAISEAIEGWMNSASDHFYDLDEDKAPEPLKKLADLTLRIGHGFTGETWTIETIDEIRDLWQQSCLAVDRLLGVEPDWGEW